ncbi:MAG: ABC transporter permease [Ardenticatenaceae bacterium]|nr:ABC transporter permease [Ardenticatenaceae bacterium]
MNILNIAYLTIREGQKRSIVRLALIMGVLFLILFGVGLHFIFVQFEQVEFMSASEMQLPANVLTMMGLYVTNFLLIIMAVLISVASIPQEIDSRVIDTIITKPINRWEVVVGKWLGFVVLIVGYTLLLSGGVMTISYVRTGLELFNIFGGLVLMCLSGITVMTITLAGGTRLSTLANGVVAFMLYGLAFIGGWVETIGAAFRNEIAVNIGIISSLILPIEALWKKASLMFQPRLLSNPSFAGPLAVTSEPSDMMIWYTIFYVVAILGYALWSLSRRDL